MNIFKISNTANPQEKTAVNHTKKIAKHFKTVFLNVSIKILLFFYTYKYDDYQCC